MPGGRSGAGLVAAGAVVIAIGFGVALVKALELPGYLIWFVIGGGVLLVGAIRRFVR